MLRLQAALPVLEAHQVLQRHPAVPLCLRLLPHPPWCWRQMRMPRRGGHRPLTAQQHQLQRLALTLLTTVVTQLARCRRW